MRRMKNVFFIVHVVVVEVCDSIVDEMYYSRRCDVWCGVNTSIVLVVVFTFFDLAQVFFYEDNASTNRS